MEVMPATPEQIVVFKKAAAAEYVRLGIKPDVAEQRFAAYMDKVAKELGVVQQPLTKRADALATELAKALGRTRK